MDEPLSILNIGPVRVPVELNIGGKKIPAQVKPVSAEDIIPLLVRFEEFKLLLDNRASEITPARLTKMGPEALGAVLASCLVIDDKSLTGNVQAEAMCRTMGIANQLKVLKAAIPISFPDGIGPFVEDLRELMEGSTTTTPTMTLSQEDESKVAA